MKYYAVPGRDCQGRHHSTDTLRITGGIFFKLQVVTGSGNLPLISFKFSEVWAASGTTVSETVTLKYLSIQGQYKRCHSSTAPSQINASRYKAHLHPSP